MTRYKIHTSKVHIFITQDTSLI
uniref:Genes for dihydroflavonol 4-reductase forflower pigmentation n=1 Tax=Ipomoea nil TaxID=35883 RepID=O22097_IPONI|nr:unnamed protein product [Ipomoea nil]